MLAVFQLSALKAQGDSPKVYTPVENYKFEVEGGKRFQEITIVDKVDVFNEKKRDEYIKEIEVKYGYDTDLKQSYCYIKGEKADFDRRGDYASASGFCLRLYSDLKCGYGPIWGLGDLSPKEFKKNLKTVMAYRRTRYVPKDEEISYYRRIAETVEHYLDSVFATCVDTVTVERKFYMPVDMNDTIVSYREVAIAGLDTKPTYNPWWDYNEDRDPFSIAWYEMRVLGSNNLAALSEENKRLCYIRSLAYGSRYPIQFRPSEFWFDFRYKNGDYVNGAKLKDVTKEGGYKKEGFKEIKDFYLTKDKGVFKKTGYSREFVLDNGDVIKSIPSDELYHGLCNTDYFPRYGNLYSASGEFKDELSAGQWESERKAAEEAREKAKEAAAQAEKEALRKELVAKYGEKMANAYLEGELMVGMPKELLDKFMGRYNYRYLGKTNWSNDTIRYRYARSLIFSVEEVYLYVRNGKLVDFTIYND